VARYASHGGKLSDIRNGWYLGSTQIKQNLRFEGHFIGHDEGNHTALSDGYLVSHVRSRDEMR